MEDLLPSSDLGTLDDEHLHEYDAAHPTGHTSGLSLADAPPSPR